MDPLLATLLVGLLLGVGLVLIWWGTRRRLEALSRGLSKPPPPPPVRESPEVAALAERLTELESTLLAERSRLERVEATLGAGAGDETQQVRAAVARLEERLLKHGERLDKARGWATEVGERFGALAEEIEALKAVTGRAAQDERRCSTEEAMRAHLGAQGLADVRLLAVEDDDTARRFEARRGNLPVKGRVRLDEQGHVVVRLATGLRAFP